MKKIVTGIAGSVTVMVFANVIIRLLEFDINRFEFLIGWLCCTAYFISIYDIKDKIK